MFIIKNLDNGLFYAGLNKWTTGRSLAMVFPTAELANKSLARMMAENPNDKFSVFEV